MNYARRMSALIAANVVCSAISAAIIYFAFRDGATRYANGVFSWSVAAFFVAFVAVTMAGVIATAFYARFNDARSLRVASAPAALAICGLALGILKHVVTGDF